MTRILRQSTAVDVRIGPFVDATDAVTPETGITLGAADQAEALRAGTATLDISAATWAAVTGCDGWYTLSLSTTATNTPGELVIVVQDASVCLAVYQTFYVVEEAVFDAFYAASAGMAVTLATGAITAAVIATGAIDADALAADTITDAKVASDVTIASVTGAVGSVTGAVGSVTGAVGSVTGAVGSVTGNVGGNVTGSVGSVAAGGITASSIAADAIGASELAADAVTEIANAVWDTDATGRQTQGTFGQAIGDPVADTGTIYKAVVTDATGVTVGTDTATLLTRMGTPSDLGGGATLAGNLSDIEAQTDDIGVAGAGLTVLATQASVNTIDDILDTEFPALVTAVDALPTNAELATALGTADDATLAAIAALNNLSAAAVNAEVVDALNVDTYAEPGQGAPAATLSLAGKIGYLFKSFRNKKTQDATDWKLFADDAATVDQKSAVSDNGTTVTRGEVASGP